MNADKCEFLSEDPNECIKIKDRVLGSNQSAKYVGQIIDANGLSQVILKEESFGKFYNLLNSIDDISLLARLRLFNVYCKSKINRLLPLIAMGSEDNIRCAWKLLRKVVFRNVLRKKTLPKECMAFYKLDAYEMLCRPLIKALSNEFFANDSDEYQCLRQGLRVAIGVLLTEEVNLGDTFRQELGRIATDFSHPIDLSILDNLRINDAWTRVSRGEIDSNIHREYILPTVLLYLSNAKIHEIEGRLKRAARTEDPLIKSKETSEAKGEIRKYCVALEYLDKFQAQEERKISDDWDTIAEEIALDDTIISVRLGELVHFKSGTEKIFNVALLEVEDESESGNPRLKSAELRNLLLMFRERVMNAVDQSIWDIEKVLDGDAQRTTEEEPFIKEQTKRAPGRPKVQKVSNNLNIRDYFKLKPR